MKQLVQRMSESADWWLIQENNNVWYDACVLYFIFDLHFFWISASQRWLKIVLSFNLHCH